MEDELHHVRVTVAWNSVKETAGFKLNAVSASLQVLLSGCPCHHFGQVINDAAHLRVLLQDGREQLSVPASHIGKTPDRTEIVGAQNRLGHHSGISAHRTIKMFGLLRLLFNQLEHVLPKCLLLAVNAGPDGLREVLPGPRAPHVTHLYRRVAAGTWSIASQKRTRLFQAKGFSGQLFEHPGGG